MSELGSSLPPWCTLVRADNPSPMTLEGTNTYVLRSGGARPGGVAGTGTRAAVVVDPGPRDEAHLRAVAALGPVGVILLTHGHPDHSAGARLLHEMTGAPVVAADPAFCIDAVPWPAGTVLDAVAGLRIRVVPTPGHTSDSVCFAVAEEVPGQHGQQGRHGLLTGDTILGRGTTVVAHPDGRLGDYLASLASLRDLGTLGALTLLPGHGPPGGDAGERATAYLAHRAQRLDQVRAAVAAGATTAPEVVRLVYADVEEGLWPAAELSVLAQLDYLTEHPQPR